MVRQENRSDQTAEVPTDSDESTGKRPWKQPRIEIRKIPSATRSNFGVVDSETPGYMVHS